jgi:hypothetical protein
MVIFYYEPKGSDSTLIMRPVNSKGDIFMFHVCIDVANEKHDCCILDSDGNVLKDSFTFANNRKGFQELLAAMRAAGDGKSPEVVRVGLESYMLQANRAFAPQT